MRTKLGKSVTGMSMILSVLATTTNSASSNMNGFEDCRRASTDELNDMRGGFLVNADGTQFLLSLGIERITYVNGAMVAMSTFNLLPQLNSSELRSAIYSQVNAAIQQNAPSASSPETAATGSTGATSPAAPAGVPSSTASASAASGANNPVPSGAAVAQNSQPTPSSAPPGTGNYQNIQVVQIGPGNTFTPPSAMNLSSGTLAVIQNTLDNQVIRNMTIINATLATRELLRSMALSTALSRIPANFGR